MKLKYFLCPGLLGRRNFLAFSAPTFVTNNMQSLLKNTLSYVAVKTIVPEQVPETPVAGIPNPQ